MCLNCGAAVAAIFITLIMRQLAAFTRSLRVVGMAEVVSLDFVVAGTLIAFRRVSGEGRLPVLMKSARIAALYFIAGVTGLVAALAVAVLAG